MSDVWAMNRGAVRYRQLFKFRRDRGMIHFDGWSVPDPFDSATPRALEDAHNALYPDISTGAEPPKVTIDRDALLKLMALARTYVNLSSPQLQSKPALAKLRRIKEACRKAVKYNRLTKKGVF